MGSLRHFRNGYGTLDFVFLNFFRLRRAALSLSVCKVPLGASLAAGQVWDVPIDSAGAQPGEVVEVEPFLGLV